MDHRKGVVWFWWWEKWLVHRCDCNECSLLCSGGGICGWPVTLFCLPLLSSRRSLLFWVVSANGILVYALLMIIMNHLPAKSEDNVYAMHNHRNQTNSGCKLPFFIFSLTKEPFDGTFRPSIQLSNNSLIWLGFDQLLKSAFGIATLLSGVSIVSGKIVKTLASNSLAL